jgi:hypothetical protein
MELDQLREHAVDLGRRSDWAGVLGLAEQLRHDSDYWHWFFAPLLAVAARHLDDPAAPYLPKPSPGLIGPDLRRRD